MLWPTALLLLGAQISSTESARDLVCVNDFLHTINCSLRDQRPHNTAYWFRFSWEVLEKHALKMKRDKCSPSYMDSSYFCSFTSPETETFPDGISFQIDLCHDADDCEVLEKNYSPKKNITPIAPSELSVVLNSSQFHFSWVSSYEAYLPNFYLLECLKYELQMEGEGNKEPPKSVTQSPRSFTADVEKFAAGVVYTARVRSAPDGNEYRGQWSRWSQEISWRTPEETGSLGLAVSLIITVCLLLTVLLLLGSIPLLRLRKRTFIPTPVLHFSPSTKSYQGDIQSLAVTLGIDKASMETENAAQLCVLTERDDVPVEDPKALLHQDPGTLQGAPCGGDQKPALDVSSLGFPYSVSPGPDNKSRRAPESRAPESHAPESRAQDDSGCWHCSVSSVDGERSRGWYRNAYCTLSDRRCTLDLDPDLNLYLDPDHQSSTAAADHRDPEGFFRRALDYQNQDQQLSVNPFLSL